jgi:hypothetical protein
MHTTKLILMSDADAGSGVDGRPLAKGNGSGASMGRVIEALRKAGLEANASAVERAWRKAEGGQPGRVSKR